MVYSSSEVLSWSQAENLSLNWLANFSFFFFWMISRKEMFLDWP